MLSKAVNEGLPDPAMKARFADLGAQPMPLTQAAFGKFIADETEKWAKVIPDVQHEVGLTRAPI